MVHVYEWWKELYFFFFFFCLFCKVLIFLTVCFVLENSWLTMLWWLWVHSGVTQLYVHTRLSSSQLLSYPGCVAVSRVPELCSISLWVIHYKCGSVCASMLGLPGCPLPEFFPSGNRPWVCSLMSQNSFNLLWTYKHKLCKLRKGKIIKEPKTKPKNLVTLSTVSWFLT